MKIKATILSVFCFILAPSLLPVLAQSGGQAGAFSRMGFSPRGMALGNAMTAVHQEGSYAYYNPAMAAISGEQIQVDLSTAALTFDRQLHMVSAHFQLPPMAGFSVSLINARVSNIDGRTQSGYHTNMLSAAEYQFIGNFGLRFSDSFWAGIGIKYNLSSYHTEIPSAGNVGIDIGIRVQLSPEISFGAAVKDLLSENDINTSDLYGTDPVPGAEPYPVRYLAGLSWQISDRWLASSDFEYRSQRSEMVRTVVHNQNGFDQEQIVRDDIRYGTQFVRLGSSYILHERLTLRGGLRLNDLGEENLVLPSAGFSLHLPFDTLSPSVDYAFVREPNGISFMHVFSLRLNI